MKDETKGTPIVEFVGLKSKMYWFIKADHKKDKKGNRIYKSVVKNATHKEYENTFLEKKQMRHNMKRMQVKSHQLGTFQVKKVIHHFFDDDIHFMMELKLFYMMIKILINYSEWSI